MKGRPDEKLSAIEKQVIAEIRAMRSSTGNALHATLLNNPARLIHHFIVSLHGNPQLRMHTLARELGVEMRTLERAFPAMYGETMTECQIKTRLKMSCWMLSLIPPTKISAIAASLGYEQVQDFNRFFKKRMHQSPAEWRRQAHDQLASQSKKLTEV